MSTDSASGSLPVESASPDWPGWRLSDAELMLEHHVTRWKVRKARETAGARALPRGRRRGGTTPVRHLRRPASELIVERIAHESGHVPPTMSVLSARVVALQAASSAVSGGHPANRHAAALDFKDALVSLASACGLVMDHLQLLEVA